MPICSRDAIECDIARLRTLMPHEAWPTSFIDLNAARNFVGQWCYDKHFKYAGWPDVELRKYRLFVNFNAAKYTLEAGVFEVERAVPPLIKTAKDHRDESAVRTDEVEVVEVKVPTNEEHGTDEESEGAPVFDLAAGIYCSDHCVRVDDISSASASPSTHTSFSSSEIDVESAPITPAPPEPEKATATIDPFKASAPASLYPDSYSSFLQDLIEELQRGYVLKVVFE
ncbi:hypothetical protein SLS61_007693 [Didymella pomorum]